MTDTRDTRGIATFIVRFLLFYVVALLVFSFPLLPGLTFLLSFGMMGVFTFIQVMASISQKLLDQPVAWKAAVIAGAIVFDGAVLWLLGLLLVVVFDGGSAWIAVAEWLPSHVSRPCARGGSASSSMRWPHKILRPQVPWILPPNRLIALPKTQTP